MTEETLTFPVFQKSWGDKWFEQGVKDDQLRTKEKWFETFDRLTEDESVRRLIELAMDLELAQEVGMPQFIDEGRYLVIPLDYDRELHREAHEEVNGSKGPIHPSALAMYEQILGEDDDPREGSGVVSTGGM